MKTKRVSHKERLASDLEDGIEQEPTPAGHRMPDSVQRAGGENSGAAEFTRCLIDLLDKSGSFSKRGEWAEYLGVTQPAISQWVKGRTVPQPEKLRMIVRRVEDTDGAPAELLEQFNRMAAKPAVEVSAIGDRMGFSVAEYLLKPRRDALLRRLRRLGVSEQETLLDHIVEALDAAEQCHLTPVSSRGEIAELNARRQAELLYERSALPAWARTHIAELLLGGPTDRRDEILREFCISAFEQIFLNNKQTPYLLLSEMMKSPIWQRDRSSLELSHVPAVLATLFLAKAETSVVVTADEPVTVRGTPVYKFILRGSALKREDLPAALGKIDLQKATLKMAGSEPSGIPEFTVADLAGSDLTRADRRWDREATRRADAVDSETKAEAL